MARSLTAKVWIAAALLALCTGCPCGHKLGLRPTAVVAPPAYATTQPAPPAAGPVISAPAPSGQIAMTQPAGPVREKSFVDRHPILAAPRNYWRDSGNNLLVKAFYSTVVGIPVGVAREAWQIIYGQ